MRLWLWSREDLLKETPQSNNHIGKYSLFKMEKHGHHLKVHHKKIIR